MLLNARKDQCVSLDWFYINTAETLSKTQNEKFSVPVKKTDNTPVTLIILNNPLISRNVENKYSIKIFLQLIPLFTLAFFFHLISSSE